MKHIRDILAHIAEGEGQRCEFKERFDNSERVAAEIVAFANSIGGTLYVGVNDEGNICGVDNSDLQRQEGCEKTGINAYCPGSRRATLGRKSGDRYRFTRLLHARL